MPGVKHFHEFRDPIHTFIVVTTDERRIIDSRPVQRLREVHQLAMSYLVYPGATHRRFEHSLGVMELAGRMFDVLMDPLHLRDEIRDAIPELTNQDAQHSGRLAVRMAGLLHDIGHLPFSHAAEHDMLPEGRGHEHLTAALICGEELSSLLAGMSLPVIPELVAKIAVGPKHWNGPPHTAWESLLSDIVTSDTFGADRMDYLLRDSLHAGVAYGRFDLPRLVQCLRILAFPSEERDEAGPTSPAIGLDAGGLHTAESLLLARYLMFSEVYFHRVRVIYDHLLVEFLKDWLPGGQYPAEPDAHLRLTDSDVLIEMRRASDDPALPGHDPARRIMRRDHYRRLYEPGPADKDRYVDPTEAIANWARDRYGGEAIRHVHSQKGPGALNFPVREFNGQIVASLSKSEPLMNVPTAVYEGVFIDRAHVEDAAAELERDRENILERYQEEGEA